MSDHITTGCSPLYSETESVCHGVSSEIQLQGAALPEENPNQRKHDIMGTKISISEESTECTVPELGKDHKYHIFISYSSGDSIWVFGLVQKLEMTIPGLKICFHERDFVPGKTIIENMIECIQNSQKTIMVLSPDFVRSRWCLFETNLSMFQGCMLHKVIIPIMLKPCPVPLHLSPLTYLEADDEQFFEKLIQVILNRHDNMPHSSLIHYQSSILYSGKTLYTLTAVNEESKKCDPGTFSSTPVPDSLRAVVDDPKIYEEAIEMINDIRPYKICIHHTADRLVMSIIIVKVVGVFAVFYLILLKSFVEGLNSVLTLFTLLPIIIAAVILLPVLSYKVAFWEKKKAKLITEAIKYKACQANLVLYESSLLVGCSSKSQLFFVYVNLRNCMKTFQTTFSPDTILATSTWKKAISMYSADYACCLAKKYFPFSSTEFTGHLKDGICFCHYVATQLIMKHHKV